jgi:hypothetical protein
MLYDKDQRCFQLMSSKKISHCNTFRPGMNGFERDLQNRDQGNNLLSQKSFVN